MSIKCSFSQKIGFPKTAVKARKRPFMTAAMIVSHFKENYFILLIRPVRLQVKFYDYFILMDKQCTGHVQVKINPGV